MKYTRPTYANEEIGEKILVTNSNKDKLDIIPTTTVAYEKGNRWFDRIKK